MDPQTYLESIVPTREMVTHFAGPREGGSSFDPELGWVLRDGVRKDGVHGSKGFYRYDPDGARRAVHFPERPCRVHTYGDSFTHCDQVSDGETWQEYLAAHFQEPIRNFGIGGYSVYQAYRRMRKVEREGGAEYIILNIYDDDHFRNLDAWRSIRMGVPGRFTLPHLRVDVENGRCEEVENLCQTPEEVYRLCDPAFVWETYRDDPTLRATLARKAGEKASSEMVTAVAAGFGARADRFPYGDPAARAFKIHTEAALYATRRVLEMTEAFVRETGKRLMVMLSFNRGHTAEALTGRPNFDQTFLDWLRSRDYPVVDMRDAFREEFRLFKVDVQTYLERYYIGHHTPAGNFFTAWAIKKRVCEWLDPRPLPYR